MKSVREVMAAMPELARFRERLEAEDWPTAAEVAAARWGLAQARVDAQGEMELESPRGR